MNFSKHEIFSFVFILIIFIEIVGMYFNTVSYKILIGSIIIFSLILAFGSYYLRFEYYLPSKTKLNNKGKTISLTFDDGPNSTVTPKLLKILEKHNVKAMFFCIGTNLLNNMDVAELLVSKGHVLGNHSYNHSNTFALLNYNKVEEEIKKTNELIENLTHKKSVYFRPPFGVTNPIIAKVVANNNLTVIGWSLRSFDTVISSNKLLTKLKKEVKHNDIILLHDLENSLKPVDEFIYYAKQKGYEFVLP